MKTNQKVYTVLGIALMLVIISIVLITNDRVEPLEDDLSNEENLSGLHSEQPTESSGGNTIVSDTGIEDGDHMGEESVTTTPSSREGTSSITAYISAIEGRTITLDHFDWLGGKAAVDAKIADGECTPEDTVGWEEGIGSYCFPNGVVYFRNKNTKLRTYDLSPDVVIVRTSAFTPSNGSGVAEVSVDELMAVDHYRELPFSVSVDSNNVVVRMEEIFRP